MEKKPAHYAILDEIERHFLINEAMGEVAKNPHNRLDALQASTGFGGFFSMGATCALLELLPKIQIPPEDIPSVIEQLQEINQKHIHGLIYNVIEKLTPILVPHV